MWVAPKDVERWNFWEDNEGKGCEDGKEEDSNSGTAFFFLETRFYINM